MKRKVKTMRFDADAATRDGDRADHRPLIQDAPGAGVRQARRRRGARAYLSGLAAEEQTARHYERTGRRIAARRWRGLGGEIDLIVRDGVGLIFIEVKQAQTFDAAAERLSLRQMGRIYDAAAEFLAGEPQGQDTESRFDVALVDGAGRIRILENAFAA